MIGGWVTYVYLFYRKVGSRQRAVYPREMRGASIFQRGRQMAVYPVKCEARVYFSGVGKWQKPMGGDDFFWEAPCFQPAVIEVNNLILMILARRFDEELIIQRTLPANR